MELIGADWNRLAPPTDAASLADTIQEAVGSKGKTVMPYGDGKAAQHIVARLQKDMRG